MTGKDRRRAAILAAALRASTFVTDVVSPFARVNAARRARRDATVSGASPAKAEDAFKQAETAFKPTFDIRRQRPAPIVRPRLPPTPPPGPTGPPNDEVIAWARRRRREREAES